MRRPLFVELTNVGIHVFFVPILKPMPPQIVKYINSHPRTKIVFVKDFSLLNDFVLIDLGKELSKFILAVRKSNLLSALVLDKLNEIIGCNTESNDEIGEYIALKNTNILFEPELKIDIRSVLEQWGKSQTILFELNRNAVKEQSRFYLERYNYNFYFDMEGLSYLEID